MDFLVIVDAHSKWPEILPMKSTTANATVSAVRDVFARFGLPVNVVTDNGPQFTSAEFTEFLKRNGVKHIRVAPYHQASNGAAESMVQTFKRSLTASSGTRLPLQQRLGDFLLKYRTTPHSTTSCTPASLFLGRVCRTRLSLLKPDTESRVLKRQAESVSCSSWREFYMGERVAVRDVRTQQWFAGTVAERSGPKSYVVSFDDGIWKRHVDHLQRSGVAEPDAVDTRLVSPPHVAATSNVHQPAVDASEKSATGSDTSTLSDKGDGTDAPQPALRRSMRTSSPPARLIEES